MNKLNIKNKFIINFHSRNLIIFKFLLVLIALIPFVSFGQQQDAADIKSDDDNVFGYYFGKSTVDEVVKASSDLTECSDIQKIMKNRDCPLKKNNYITLDSSNLKLYLMSLEELDKIISLKKQESERVLILSFYDQILFQIQVAPKGNLSSLDDELEAEFIKSLIPIFNNKYKKLKPIVSATKRSYYTQIITAQLWENKNKNFLVEIKEIKRKLDNRSLCMSSSRGLSGSRRARNEGFCSSGQDVSFTLTYRKQQIYNEAYTYVNERIKEQESKLDIEKKKKLSTY